MCIFNNKHYLIFGFQIMVIVYSKPTAHNRQVITPILPLRGEASKYEDDMNEDVILKHSSKT